MPDTSASKSLLRQQLRAARRDISTPARSAAARDACKHIIELPDWPTARRVALYMAADGEVDTAALAQLCRRADKQLFLPVMGDAQTLSFASWERDTPLQRNNYGIDEPAPDSPRCAAADLDIIVMPLVGWDREGGRLGMGGGYYDRSLCGVSGPVLVGLAFAQQQLPRVPRDAWDIPLHFVLTETALYRCSPA